MPPLPFAQAGTFGNAAERRYRGAGIRRRYANRAGRLPAEILGAGSRMVQTGFLVVVAEEIEDVVRADPEDGVRLCGAQNPRADDQAPQANAQLNAALRIHTRSTLRPTISERQNLTLTTKH